MEVGPLGKADWIQGRKKRISFDTFAGSFSSTGTVQDGGYFSCKSSSSRDCKVAGQGHGGRVPFGRDAQMKQHAWVKKVAPYGDGRQRAARNAIYL